MHSALSAASNASGRAFAKWRLLIALALVYLYAFPYFGRLRHANELPRVLTVEQLAGRGTFRLDDRMDDLGSLADISTTPDGHRYQNKAPGPSMLGAPIYVPLAAASRVAGRPPPIALVTWLLRVSLATLPTLLFLAWFRRLTPRFAANETARDGALIAIALGSMMLPLGLLFMSHALAASLVGIAFVVAVETTRDRSHPETRGAAAVGALTGLAMLCEYQALFGAALVVVYFLWGAGRRGRALITIAAAALPFMAGLALYHWSAFGSPFRTGYAYSLDVENRLGIMGIVGFSETTIAQLFVRPDNGLLLLSPWVLLAVVGAVVIAASAEFRARAGREALIAALVAIVYCVFVASLSPQFARAGWSVGPRYIAVAMPFVALLAAAGLDFCLRHPPLRVPALASIFVGVIVHVIAATTYPHWPIDFQNPFFEVSLRLLREGYAPHSVGTLIGLRGMTSVAPLYIGVIALMVYVLRRYRLELALALIVAVVAVAVAQGIAATPARIADGMWQFVTSTYEP